MDKRIKFDASRLAVARVGSGEPAVFVHGFGSNKSTWKRVCHGLKDVFSSYAIDLPGAGESPAPRHFRYTLEHLADVLTNFILMRDLRRLTLVGTSLGAAVILLAMLRNKNELVPRVRSLCLIDAVAYPQDFPFFLEVLRTPVLGPLALNLPFFINILPIPVLGPVAAASLLPQYARYYERRGVREALIKTARLINAEQLAPYGQDLKTIHLPTLVIWGREDRVVPLKFGKRLARDLPNSRLIVIDHCGHVPHQERPAKVIAALKEFVQKTGGDVSPNLLTRKTHDGEMGHYRDRNGE
jgi:pimeloyl-ACP methyl ester carboxylesterase